MEVYPDKKDNATDYHLIYDNQNEKCRTSTLHLWHLCNASTTRDRPPPGIDPMKILLQMLFLCTALPLAAAAGQQRE